MPGRLLTRIVCLAACTVVASGMACTSGEPPPSRASAPSARPASPDPRFRIAELLHEDDFTRGLDQWSVELQDGGTVRAEDGTLEIDVPAGATVWFKPQLEGPVLIEYEAAVVRAGGPNDRVSDLNCFWMARDSRNKTDLLAVRRSGAFEDYNQLTTYYVGLGGNGNTTTRFRRYIGHPQDRPLLPEHDLRDRADLLVANQPERIRLVAAGKVIQYHRGDRRVFDVIDPQPYERGHFAVRTTKSHLKIKGFRVYRLAEMEKR
jgi:hypothetical protein